MTCKYCSSKDIVYILKVFGGFEFYPRWWALLFGDKSWHCIGNLTLSEGQFKTGAALCKPTITMTPPTFFFYKFPLGDKKKEKNIRVEGRNMDGNFRYIVFSISKPFSDGELKCFITGFVKTFYFLNFNILITSIEQLQSFDYETENFAFGENKS